MFKNVGNVLLSLTELCNYGYWRWGGEDVSKQVNVTQPSPQSSSATVSQTDNGPQTSDISDLYSESSC